MGTHWSSVTTGTALGFESSIAPKVVAGGGNELYA